MKTKYVIFKYLIADLLDYLNIKLKKKKYAIIYLRIIIIV